MVFSSPFAGIPEDIREVLQELIPADDSYHVTHRRRFARTLQVLMEKRPKGRLLEIGTSGVFPAALSRLASDLKVDVTNFDMDEPLHHTVLDRLGNEHAAVRVDLENDPLPFKDESFDWVMCCEVLEHMEIDPMFMMSEINRVLKPEAVLLLTTPNVASSTGIHKMLLGLEPYLFMQYHKTREYHRHNYEYTVHSLYQVLKASGFHGLIWTEDTFEDGRPSTMRRLVNAGFDIQHTGDNIFALCYKFGPVNDRFPAAIYV